MKTNIRLVDDLMERDTALMGWLDSRFTNELVYVSYASKSGASTRGNLVVTQESFFDPWNGKRLACCDSQSPCARTNTPYTIFVRAEVTVEAIMRQSWFDRFVHHYKVAALFTEIDDDNTPLDSLYNTTDICPESNRLIRHSCAQFCVEALDDLRSAVKCEGFSWEMAAHDFWLTRNGHGAGFWDRGLRETGDRLSEMARNFGGSHVEVGSGDEAHVLSVCDDKRFDSPQTPRYAF